MGGKFDQRLWAENNPGQNHSNVELLLNFGISKSDLFTKFAAEIFWILNENTQPWLVEIKTNEPIMLGPNMQDFKISANAFLVPSK